MNGGGGDGLEHLKAAQLRLQVTPITDEEAGRLAAMLGRLPEVVSTGQMRLDGDVAWFELETNSTAALLEALGQAAGALSIVMTRMINGDVVLTLPDTGSSRELEQRLERAAGARQPAKVDRLPFMRPRAGQPSSQPAGAATEEAAVVVPFSRRRRRSGDRPLPAPVQRWASSLRSAYGARAPRRWRALIAVVLFSGVLAAVLNLAERLSP